MGLKPSKPIELCNHMEYIHGSLTKKLAWVIHLVCKWVCIVRLPAFGLNLIPAESAARSCRVKGKSMEKTMIIELRTKALGFTGPDAENQMVVSLFPSC
jgi:hypothetical protein